MSDELPLASGSTAHLLRKSELEKADVQLGAKVASTRDHPLVKAAGAASKVGDQGPLYALSAGLLLAGFATRKCRLVGSGISMLAAIAAADLGKSFTKRLIRRTRPNVLLDEGRYQSRAGGSGEKPEQSFPSGHMAGTVAVARALSRHYPRAGAATGVAALAMGVARVAKGAHWPLDVVGGAIIGIGTEAAADRVLRFTWRCVFSRLLPRGR